MSPSYPLAMMREFRPRSKSWRTDLALRGFHGRLTPGPDWLRLDTPSDPLFCSGNFLLFGAPDPSITAETWVDRFATSFEHVPGLRHMMIGWDEGLPQPAVVDQFARRGFSLISRDVLWATSLQRPERWNDGLNVRTMISDGDWEQVAKNHLADEDPDDPPERHMPAILRKLRRYRDLVDSGLGLWFGAFIGEELVGDLGIFVIDGTARFQEVGTHPSHRNQGVCRTLVHIASAKAAQHFTVRDYIVVTEKAGPAMRAYETLGFRKAEEQHLVLRVDRAD